ncbi:MAG: YihY/virulence factor BrkB family protein [Rhizobiaceae bacterium]
MFNIKMVARAFWQAIVKLNDDGGLAVASNVALSLLLSLFPFFMLIASLLRLYGDPSLSDQVVELLLGHWPAGSAEPIARTVETLLSQPAGEFFSAGTIIALVLATNGVENARDGLNRAYKIKETRSFIWRRVQGAVFVLLGALGLIVAAFILVATPLVWAFLAAKIPFLMEYSFTVTIVQYGLAMIILSFVLYAFHRFLPNMKGQDRTIIWGLLLSIFGIIAGSKLFGIYLQNIANYTALYAGLAGMMIAIVYLYCLSVLILFGAEFNTALSEERERSASL